MAAPVTHMAQGVPQIQMTGLDFQARTYAFGIAALIASCLLLAGAGWAFAAALGLEADAAALAAGAVAGVAAICGCVAFYQRGRNELVFYGVLAACVVAACIVLHGQIAAGAGQILNAAGTVAGRYSGVYATPYQQGGTFDLAALMVVFGIVCGAACAQVKPRFA